MRRARLGVAAAEAFGRSEKGRLRAATRSESLGRMRSGLASRAVGPLRPEPANDSTAATARHGTTAASRNGTASTALSDKVDPKP
jgi:hypothetical protein